MLKARIGDLAIARFDPDKISKMFCKKWNEHVCLVTGRRGSEMEFVYCESHGNGTIMMSGSLPKGRLVRVKIRPKFSKHWTGDFRTLDPSLVEFL